MQSRGLFGKKYLAIEERVREIPPPDEDHVIVKVRACGVCGTDVNFVRDWDGEPMPLGHEISAEVVEVGKSVTTVRPGDSVIVVVNLSNKGYPEYQIGFPHPGSWNVRLNSDWSGYDPSFSNHPSNETQADRKGRDEMPSAGFVSIGPYSVVVLSQTP